MVTDRPGQPDPGPDSGPDLGPELGPDVRRQVEQLRTELEQLRTALRNRPVIEQAKGVLMTLRGVDAETAFELLVVASQRSNTKVRVVAGLVVDLVTGQSPAAGQGDAPGETRAAGLAAD